MGFLSNLFGKKGDIVDIIKAVSNRDINAVTEYIKSGGDINSKDQWGSTALVWAVHYGYTDIVRILIDAKANVDSKDVNDQTALMKASDKGRTDIVKILISVNANVNARDIRGQTALIMASQNGHADVVKLLIDAKANVNTKDNEGLTALMWAKLENHSDVIGILKAADARLTKELSKTLEGPKKEIRTLITIVNNKGLDNSTRVNAFSALKSLENQNSESKEFIRRIENDPTHDMFLLVKVMREMEGK